jgi:hypothetical protein
VQGDWSSGMIPVLGTGGPGFNSRIAPIFVPSPLPFSRGRRPRYCEGKIDFNLAYGAYSLYNEFIIEQGEVAVEIPISLKVQRKVSFAKVAQLALGGE